MKQHYVDSRAFADALFRNTIGLHNSLAKFAENRAQTNYPPFNVELVASNPDRWRLTLAVAGFSRDDVEVTVLDNLLTVKGSKPKGGDDEARAFLHRGIAQRDFVQEFKLGEFIEVKSASLENGLLVIDLEHHVPEARKPKLIAIG